MAFKQVEEDVDTAKQNSRQTANDELPRRRVHAYRWKDEADNAGTVPPGRVNRNVSDWMRR